MSAGFVEEKLASGDFRSHDAATAELPERIREGAAKSDRLELGLRDILDEQGLAEPL